MERVIHTKMSGGRRIAIPAEVCQKYGLEPGTPVVIEPTDHGIVVRPFADVVRDVQAFFKDAAPSDALFTEEVSRDRTEESSRKRRG